MQFNAIKEKLAARDQLQVLRCYDALTEQQRIQLLEQIAALDLSLLEHIGQSADAARGHIAPLGALTLPEIAAQKQQFTEQGLEALKQGKVGAVLLAGGQGTRLGLDGPKGTLNVGVSRKLYLFECLVQNLLAVVRQCGAWVPLYVMTSEKNHAETTAFFEAHGYFGYAADQVHFFKQEMAPAVDFNGKLLLEDACTVCTSPNGNGGWFSSMARAGLLEHLHDGGVEWLNVFAVDNVLQQIADPCFIGATLASGCASGAKVVAKANADERVGVLCLEDGRPSIVEYYEMTEEMRTMREADGRLSYNYGVILNYLFRVDRLEEIVGHTLPVHVVEKKIPYMDENGVSVNPDKANGYKFETLVLDMVHMQESCLSFEVERSREFAPIKNATGVDSLESARVLLEQNGIAL